METTTHTLCSLCHSPQPVVPYESYLPLCDECKARLFRGRRENTRSYLEQELSVLRSLSSQSTLLAAFQLYDSRLLQQIYSDTDEDEALLDALIAEADKLYYAIGRSLLPALFHQLALYFYNAGWYEDAHSLLQDVLGGINCGYLLYGQPEDLLQPHLAACYTHLAMVYSAMGDTARQVWALHSAILHRRNQVTSGMKQLNELEKLL